MMLGTRRLAVTAGALICCLVAGAGSSAAARAAANPCAELPASVRSACLAPGVHCTVRADAHKRWEVVFGSEPTKAKAEITLKKAKAKGFAPVGIESDIHCSNGIGVYEVVRSGFKHAAEAVALVAEAKAKGFSARSEDS